MSRGLEMVWIWASETLLNCEKKKESLIRLVLIWIDNKKTIVVSHVTAPTHSFSEVHPNV